MRGFATLIAISTAMAAAGTAVAAGPDEVNLSGQGAWAADRFYVHVGPGALIMNEGATIKEAGVTIPGATISIAPQVTAVGEVGYFFNRNVAISFTGGYPPTATVVAAGSLAGYGTVGRATYGPVTITAHYHFTGLGRFKPYVGAGPVLMVVLKNEDGLMTDLHTHASTGFAVQGGAEVAVDRHWGVFFDVKKALLKTNATGYLGPDHVTARIRMDPLVLNGGLAYRF